ncbi:MAG: sensor histidine kinase [Pseudomonadota bacterium]
MKYPSSRSVPGHSLWLDMLLALACAVLAGVVAAQLELGELIFQFTRRFERYQLDEWPTALLVFALVLVVLYARRHAQLRRVLQENRACSSASSRSRNRSGAALARELHDELGQTLNAVKLDAMSLPDSAISRRIAENADHVYRVTADMVRHLRPPALDELGLVAALEACVSRWRESYPQLDVQLSVGGLLDGLGETLNLALYRLVQESLTNCVRHAGATHFYIDLTRAPELQGSVLLEMRDDGSGMGADPPKTDSGLAGMRERAALLGGRFELLSERGKGVTIRIELPVDKE